MTGSLITIITFIGAPHLGEMLSRGKEHLSS